MRIFSTVLMVIGAIALAVLLFFMTGVFLYSLAPAINSQMTISPVSYDAVKSFDNKFDTFKDDVKKAAAAGQKVDVSLKLTEEELNSKIVELLADGELPCRDLLVNFEDDYIWLYAVMNNRGIDAKIGLVGKFDIVDSDVSVIVEDFFLGKLPITKSTDEKVGKLLDIVWIMQNPFKDMPVKLTYISIDKGSITFEGVTTAAE
jgi:hypothetical protein